MILARAVPRSGDLVARYGGEEFAVLLAATDGEGSHQVAQRMVDAVREAAIPHPASPVASVITISAGSSSIVSAENDTESLLKQADRALYTAKETGRDRALAFRQTGKD